MIYVVIVLYNKRLSDCDAVEYFLETACAAGLDRECTLAVYDNSPEVQKIPANLASGIHYVHNGANGGVADAYNYGLSMSRSDGDWLVLSDHDSQFPASYLHDMVTLIHELKEDSSIVAIAPHVCCAGKPVSPCTVHLGGRVRPLALAFSGLHRGEIVAINSGMAIRVSFVKRIGGFNSIFWLDYLDYWLCRMIHSAGKRIYIASPVIDHDLSVCDYDHLTEGRVENILRAEMDFYRHYKPWGEQVLYIFRLLYRGLKQIVQLDNKRIALTTLRAIRLFVAG